MSNPHKIVLIGFSTFERATFESFFRLAARRPPGYVLVSSPAEASLAVVNADDAAVLNSAIANKPCPHVMLIGNSDGGTGWTLQRRPLNLMKVLTNVELLLNPQGAAHVPASAPVRAAPPVPDRTVGVPSGFFASRQFARTDRAPMMPNAAPVPPRPAPVAQAVPPAYAAPAVRSAFAPASSAQPATTARRNDVRVGMGETSSRADTPVLGGASQPHSLVNEAESGMDHILVVDDSDIALKFMRNRLTRFGFRTDLANSGEEALGRLGTQPYKFVFLDVMMEGLDGYQTCRAIKQRKYTEGKPPVVVMLTSRGGTIDKIRGTLAGCDAYLTKPLNERDLIAVLAKHDRTVARGFQATNFGGSAKSGYGAVPTRG